MVHRLIAWQEPAGGGRGGPNKRTQIDGLLIDWLVGRSLVEVGGVDPKREHWLMVHWLIAWQESTSGARGGSTQEAPTLTE